MRCSLHPRCRDTSSTRRCSLSASQLLQPGHYSLVFVNQELVSECERAVVFLQPLACLLDCVAERVLAGVEVERILRVGIKQATLSDSPSNIERVLRYLKKN